MSQTLFSRRLLRGQTAARGLLATDKDLKNEAYKLMGH